MENQEAILRGELKVSERAIRPVLETVVWREQEVLLPLILHNVLLLCHGLSPPSCFYVLREHSRNQNGYEALSDSSSSSDHSGGVGRCE